jgi:hypothetical protein
MIPCEAPLVYYDRAADERGALFEGFEFADDFLLTHRIGRRPEGKAGLGAVPEVVEAVTEETLAARPASASADTPVAPTSLERSGVSPCPIS